MAHERVALPGHRGELLRDLALQRDRLRAPLARGGDPRARVHRLSPRHPPRARVRALHRGANPPRGCVATVLHSPADPLSLRDHGGGHPHALRHPHAASPARHRGLRSARGDGRGHPALRVGRRALAGRPARRERRRRDRARELAGVATHRPLLRPAHPRRDGRLPLAGGLRGLGRHVRDDDQPPPGEPARRGARRLLPLRPPAERLRAVGSPLDARVLLRQPREESFVARDVRAGFGLYHLGRHIANSQFWLLWFEVLAVIGTLSSREGQDRIGVRPRARSRRSGWASSSACSTTAPRPSSG